MSTGKDPFRTRDHVADFDDIVSGFVDRSIASRARLRSVLDVRYGDGERETLDLFLPLAGAAPLPVHVFVHGGYWRMFAKEDFSFVADAVVASGAIAVIVDYALMPVVRMSNIVDQVRRAVRWTAANIGRFGGDPSEISVSGHSAGAHLCCWLLTSDAEVPPISSALLVSGVYDLQPLRSSFLQELIGLTEDEAERWSPLSARFHTEATVSVVVGEKETAPFHDQAGRLVAHLASQRIASSVLVLPGHDHMTIVGADNAGSWQQLLLRKRYTEGEDVSSYFERLKDIEAVQF